MASINTRPYPMQFLWWGYVKSRVFPILPLSVNHLCATIELEFEVLARPNFIRNTLGKHCLISVENTERHVEGN